jgi:sulfide:quinone oxidoreductase
MDKRHVLILGGGTGGTIAANRLRRSLPDDSIDITVVDENDDHIYQPGLLFIPFGLTQPSELVRPRSLQLHGGIGYLQAKVNRVDLANNLVRFEGGRSAS